ncbi:MAG: tetratricopeptide repeat protein, partial [Pirellulales bacterium]|nr:tetratricopeptide repeat protein [Pirellulales bacterium]
VEAFLETFHPDWQTLPGVWQYFSQSSGPEQLDSLVQYAKDAAQAECQTRDHESAAKVLHKLATMQADRQQFDAALTTLQAAIQVSPDHYLAHRALGPLLLQAGRYELAEKHLRWCHTRRPEDLSVERALEALSQQRHQASIQLGLARDTKNQASWIE